MKHLNTNWNYEDEESKLLAIGAPNPDFEAIVALRHARKNELVGRLSLRTTDRVLDLGSGMGFIAEVVAPCVAKLYCTDVSDTFLADCRKRCASFQNIEIHKINYADCSPVYGKEINKVYSTLLFIHFNFYDFVLYLQELNKVMIKGGLLYFDYNDGDRFNFSEPSESFNQHLALYKEHREHWIFGCMHMSSYSVIKNLAPQLGFRILGNWCTPSAFSQMLLAKVDDLK